MVPRPLIVYDPGSYASPITKTWIERVSAMRDAGTHADHLVRHPRLDLRLHGAEELSADVDRPQLRKIDAPIAPHHHLVGVVLIAVEQHIERIARTDDVVGRHRDVGQRLEARRILGEQVVAEGLQRLLARSS